MKQGVLDAEKLRKTVSGWREKRTVYAPAEREGYLDFAPVADDAEPRDVMCRMIAAVPPARVELHRPTLEDVFVEIVARERGCSQRELLDALRGIETESAGTVEEGTK